MRGIPSWRVYLWFILTCVSPKAHDTPTGESTFPWLYRSHSSRGRPSSSCGGNGLPVPKILLKWSRGAACAFWITEGVQNEAIFSLGLEWVLHTKKTSTTSFLTIIAIFWSNDGSSAQTNLHLYACLYTHRGRKILCLEPLCLVLRRKCYVYLGKP